MLHHTKGIEMTEIAMRKVTIVMPSTVENYRAINKLLSRDIAQGWQTSTNLLRLPKIGETWKDGTGQLQHLEPSADPYWAFESKGESTWGGWDGNTYHSDGLYMTNQWSTANLVELVDECVIHVGEYWRDRVGNIHRITAVEENHDYTYFPVISKVGDRDLRWAKDGHHHITGRGDQWIEHDLDLIEKVNI